MSKPTILLVDYDPRSIEATTQPLQDLGYRVEVAKDGLAGIEAYKRLSPDLVLLEMMLPKKHGLEVCQELRRAGAHRRTPIVILGRTASERYRIQAVSAGANDYVTRPLASDKLVEICNSLLMEDPETLIALELEAAPAPPGAAALAAPPSPNDSDLAGLSDDEILARLDALLPSDPEAPMPSQAATQTPSPATVTPAVAPPPPVPEPIPVLAQGVVPTAPPEPVPARPPRLSRQERVAAARETPPVDLPDLGRPTRSRALPLVIGACAVAAAAGLVYVFVLRGPAATPETAASRPEQFVPRVPVLPPGSAVSPPESAAPSIPEAPPQPAAAATEQPRPVANLAPPTTHPPAPTHIPSTEPVRPAAPPPTLPAATSSSAELPRSPAPAAPDAASDAIVEGGVVAVPSTTPPETAAANGSGGSPEAVQAGALVDLAQVDVPPVPRTRVQPSYPAVARGLRVEAKVVLRLLVDERGRVAVVEADAGESAATFAEEARKAARDWTYSPASKGGVPVKVWIVERITFKP